ncbi:hypothetical protein H0H93_005441 [Arthromyces matolae]|nr:hypothetical protein H0H93_005441 [Arthromyces matolae]
MSLGAIDALASDRTYIIEFISYNQGAPFLKSYSTPSMEKVRHGSCLCRSVQFTATGEPSVFEVCYCSNCRKASGSAFMALAFLEEKQLKITQGREHVKVYRDTDTKSGNALLRSFCPTCGAPLFISDDTNSFLVISMGTIEDSLVDWGEEI